MAFLQKIHMKNKKKFAIAQSPIIEAVIEQLLRLASEQQAITWLETIKNNFIISKQQIYSKNKYRSLILWIKGFSITEEEAEKGCIGNFAVITYRYVNGKWTLYPTKINVPITFHPQRRYQNNSKYPNWGHPILRIIRKKKSYRTVEEARSDLTTLHEQFPIASIPAKNKLYLMIFSRESNAKKTVKKYVLEIKVLSDGIFIDFKINNYNKKRQKEINEKRETNGIYSMDKPIKGYFTSIIELTRKK